MLRAGDRVGPFLVTATLGSGGMGAVFAATDTRLGRQVAIKVLQSPGDEEGRQRLIREARVAASLDHPALVSIFELGEHEGAVYLVMELVRGKTLAALLDEQGPAPPGAAAAIGAAIARATAAAHCAGVVHRDLKPRNVMLKADGTVKVLDFGLAKPMEETARITVTGAVHGTPLYLAPELLDGSPPTPLSDVWALGVTLVELCTGLPPFAGRSLPHLFTTIASAEPMLGSLVDPVLAGVARRALAKAPSERFASMDELAAELAGRADPVALTAWSRPALGADSSPRPSSAPSATVSGQATTQVDPGPGARTTEAADPQQAPTIRGPASSARSTRPLDENALDDLAGRIPSLPEPVASLAVGVEVARAEGDATGIRKRLFELGVGVVRYATAVGLSVLAARLVGASAPKPIADVLAKAARLSDGSWCDLARRVGGALKPLDARVSKALAFTSGKPLAELVSARNDFIHGGGTGDAALPLCLAVLDGAADLLALPLRVVAALSPPSFEARAGTPVRAGVWRKTPGEVPANVEPGAAYIVLPSAATSSTATAAADGVPASPWLPVADKRVLLPDSPHAPGKPWRSSDPETGEHRESPALDRAVRALVGDDTATPREPTDRPALVGRDAAIFVLKRAAEEARNGGVRVVVLTGSFGMGRSRMTQAIHEAAAGFGLGRALEGACSPERRSALRPLRRAVEEAAGLDGLRDAIGRALTLDPVATRAAFEAAIESVEEAFVQASLVEPMLLALDDVQWADEHTLAVLRLLTERATRKANGKLLVVAVVRDEPNPSPALRRFIGQVEADVGSGATRLSLGALSADLAAKVVQGVAPMDPAIERVTVQSAGGVPFFLVQPLLVWHETGALVWKDGAYRPRDESVLQSAAPGVLDLVRARLGSFFDPGSEAERAAHHVLACIALYGADLPGARLLAAVDAVGTSAAAAEHALEALVEAGLLAVRGERQEHAFAQGVVRQAVLEDLEKRPWFRRVHRALLDAITSDATGADAAFLAAGYFAVGMKDEASSWLARAIDHALATGSFDDAAALGEKLAETGRDPAERARGGLAVADALARAGRTDAARQALDRVSPPAGSLEAVRARVLDVTLGVQQRSGDAQKEDELLALADACEDASLRIEALLAVALRRRGEQGVHLSRTALDLAGSASTALRYRALNGWIELVTQTHSATLEERRSASEQARKLAQELGSTWAELDADSSLGAALSDAKEHAEALQIFSRVRQSAKKLGYGTLEREALVNAATTELRAGRPERAAQHAEEATSAARSAGDTRILTMALSLHADALSRAGDPARALVSIDEAVRLCQRHEDYTTTLALLRRANIAEALGKRDVVRADLLEARARAQKNGNVDHEVRADLSLAIQDHESRGASAASDLEAAVSRARAVEAKLRAPTQQVLARASSLLTSPND